jgi:hypothetical protein
MKLTALRIQRCSAPMRDNEIGMVPLNLLSEEFSRAASAAWNRARQDALKNGQPVFFQGEDGRYILEQPDGKRYEIRFLPGVPRDANFEIVRELPATAA